MSPRSSRKKTLPVPGDVFIGSDGLMRIITLDGYEVQQFHRMLCPDPERDVEYHAVTFHRHTWEEVLASHEVTPQSFLDNWEKHGFYYLGNALTDEWCNG